METSQASGLKGKLEKTSSIQHGNKKKQKLRTEDGGRMTKDEGRRRGRRRGRRWEPGSDTRLTSGRRNDISPVNSVEFSSFLLTH